MESANDSAELPRETVALIKRDDVESYELERVELRQPKDDEVVIRVDAVALCGSDITLYKWNDLAKTIATLPFIPGHECTGTVVAAGRAAFVTSSSVDWMTSTTPLLVGQRVAIENHFYCGRCSLCAEGRGDICLDMGQFGHGKKTDQGGCSEYAIVPARYCYPIKSNIDVEEAVLLEPLGVAHNAVERLEVKGQQVLVLGCGPIGLLACSVAKALGATR